MRILLGVNKHDKLPPRSAPLEERRQWNQSMSIKDFLSSKNHTPSGELNSEELLMVEVRKAGIKPDGESYETLRIILDTLRRGNVKSFRPEPADLLSSPSNAFLWRIVTVILIRLLQAGEYTGVTKMETNPQHIYELVVAHMKGTWHRRCVDQSPTSLKT